MVLKIFILWLQGNATQTNLQLEYIDMREVAPSAATKGDLLSLYVSTLLTHILPIDMYYNDPQEAIRGMI